MASNLWNTQSPTKRIDLCFKIDDYKKHLLQLKNVKSTFKKFSPICLPKNIDFDNSSVSRSRFKKVTFNDQGEELVTIQDIRRQKRDDKIRKTNHRGCRILAKSSDHAISKRLCQLCSSSLKFLLSNYVSKQVQKIQRQENNLGKQDDPKKTIKCQGVTITVKQEALSQIFKLQPQVQAELATKQMYFLLMKIDKHVDFTKQAEKLLRGGKIRFSKIKAENLQSEIGKGDGVSLDWRATQSKLLSSSSQCQIFQKPPR